MAIVVVVPLPVPPVIVFPLLVLIAVTKLAMLAATFLLPLAVVAGFAIVPPMVVVIVRIVRGSNDSRRNLPLRWPTRMPEH